MVALRGQKHQFFHAAAHKTQQKTEQLQKTPIHVKDCRGLFNDVMEK